jgi:adenylate kinase
MRLVILGPPGAGKGTQAARLAAHYGVPAVSTGDIFRANISEGTPLGVQVKEILDSGGYVSDDITNAMVRDRLAQPDAEPGFLLDGYPRTKAQVDELETMLAEGGHALDVVAELTVDREEIVDRLLRRAQTDGRTDDTEDVIRRRQQIYADETAPLVEVYR